MRNQIDYITITKRFRNSILQVKGYLYWNQQAAVRHNGDISESISIKQGVRQGCVASPHLFVLYTEMIMRSIDDMEGIKMGGGHVINNLRYADDTVIIAESKNQLQQLMEESEAKGLFLNSAMSFTLWCSRSLKWGIHVRSQSMVTP